MFRKTDPHTSAQAAAKAITNASKGRVLALEALTERPMNDFELAAHTGWQQTSIGKRRLECQRAGWVEPLLDDEGDQIMRKSPSNTNSLVWQISAKGRSMLPILIEDLKT